VRFAWDLQHQYLSERGLLGGLKSFMARIVLHYIRNWDVRSAGGVDVFLSNSNYVGRRIRKVYRRSSTTIHPPVDVDRFVPGSGVKEDFFLTASRLVPYKRVDLVVEAFQRMPERRLIVIGDGPEFKRIKALAGPNVQMVGHQDNARLVQYMQLARAFIFAGEEDFGILPVEAQACGTPVIAFGRGGVTETVIDGITGILFGEQSPEAIVAAVERFETCGKWDEVPIRQNAERFSAEQFRVRIAREIMTHMDMPERVADAATDSIAPFAVTTLSEAAHSTPAPAAGVGAD
jgi:glycosyltransferase involved in cell wall biosynthesis